MSPLSPDEIAVFQSARRQVDRSIVSQQGQTPLLDARLRALSLRLVGDSLAQRVDERTPFPAMLWYGGVLDTRCGYRFKGTVGDFVEHVLRARAREVAKKRCGWVVEPVTNKDGWRGNDSTIAMHALFLDCDDCGSWDVLLTTLADLGVVYIAYQSGGWSPTAAKWRVVLPLAHPFDTTSLAEQAAWKAAYNVARVVFGSIAGLIGGGFDATTETPCIPWFVTERRRAEDAPREVLWRPGRALNLAALAAALPAPPVEERPSFPDDRVDAETAPLDDEHLERAVSRICEAMAPILFDRRDLYLALPGALLDLGVDADDVRTVVEEVSERCPGDPSYSRVEVAAKHREHLHCCETTVRRWEGGGAVTRIGTIVERWPEVARALDEAFPERAAARAAEDRAEVELFLAGLSRGAPLESASVASLASAPPRAPSPVRLSDVRRQIAARGRHLRRRLSTVSEKVRGHMLAALLCGDDLVPYVVKADGSREPFANSEGKPFDRSAAIAEVMGEVARRIDLRLVPESDPFACVSQIARASLAVMLSDGERVTDLIAEAERAFVRAFRRRARRIEAKHGAAVRSRLERGL